MRALSVLKTVTTVAVSLAGLWQQHSPSPANMLEIPKDLILRLALALVAAILELIASLFGLLGLLLVLWPGLSIIGLVGYVGVIYATLALLAWVGSEVYASRLKASLTPKTFVTQALSAFRRGWHRAQSSNHA